ncbi:MAG: hypothetical protein PHH82_01910 [Candidatus ainarchaeum sp.]|nr:hypothetical protein [Candidatus ainarchaeum sp.]
MQYIRTRAKPEERIMSLRRRLERRNIVRTRVGKKEMLTPLQIASRAEVKEAVARGFAPFYHNGEKIEIPLREDKLHPLPMNLQGVYASPEGGLFVLRGGLSPTDHGLAQVLKVNHFVKNHPLEQPTETWVAFCWIDKDQGLHLEVRDQNLRHRGLALKLLDRTIRSYTAKRKNPQSAITVLKKDFEPVLEKYGARVIPIVGGDRVALINKNVDPKANVEKYHSFEAIDPQSGRLRVYRIKV